MDEPRKPPGKLANNWGRRDNIRAGAVSGPWRSVPRSDARDSEPPSSPVSPPAKPVRPVAAAGGPPRPGRPEDPDAFWPIRPADTPQKPSATLRQSPAVGEAHTTVQSEAPTLRTVGPDASAPPRRGSLVPAIFAGIVIAAAIIGAAVYLRESVLSGPAAPESTETVSSMQVPEQAPAEVDMAPAQGDATDVTDVTSEPAGGGVTQSAPLPRDAAPAAVSSQTALRLRLSPGYPAAERTALLDALAAAGHESVVVEEIPFRIAISRVGYYAEGDKSAAETLAREIAPALGEPEGSVVVRDYGNLLPDATPGRLDLWIRSPE